MEVKFRTEPLARIEKAKRERRIIDFLTKNDNGTDLPYQSLEARLNVNLKS
ncbi:hypothetical protein TRIP_D170021 [uncultured Paludibacter sp.]|nr:hypothetical protein TRIP_D170021 [uncultured Paludibacter sp.]